MPRFSKRAKRHASESKMRTQKMLRDSEHRSGPVTVSYLPGFEPPPTVRPDPMLAHRTRFPFAATINGRPVIVHKTWIDHAC